LKFRKRDFIADQFLIKTMPTYEYLCTHCGQEHEAFQRMSEDPLTICPACEEPSLKRKIGLGAGIIFKGGGFYETDFKDRKGNKTESGGKSEGTGQSDKAASSGSESTAAKSGGEAKNGSTAATSSGSS